MAARSHGDFSGQVRHFKAVILEIVSFGGPKSHGQITFQGLCFVNLEAAKMKVRLFM